MRRGLRAGVSTALALGTGLLTNLVTADWAWPVVAGLVVFGAGWIALEVFWRPETPAPEAPPPPRQLPAGTRDIVGRSAELARLDRLTTRATVCAIVGTAGVGKTTLAVHWARRAADRFPGGQLYINLRGFEPDASPLTPAEALDSALAALSVPVERLPDGLDARAALLRSVTAQQRVLLLLDNARDAAQVRPLIPGSRGSLALVTSRDRLTGLVAVEDAPVLDVGLLPAGDGRRFLERRLGPAWLAADPSAADEIVRRCQGLPLALAIVAAQAAARPALTPAVLAGQLRLATLGGDEPAADLRAVLSWSYRALTPAAARVFRMLSLHPAPTATAAELGALAGEDPGPALAELTRAHLLDETAASRYTCHDLLREYAAELSAASEPQPARRDALGRLLAHALAEPVDLALRVALVRRAAAEGFAAEADLLSRSVEDPLRLLGRWEELAGAAGAAAELAPDPEAEARLRHALAEALFRRPDLDGAEQQARRAAALTSSAELRLAALMLLARVHAAAGRREQALAAAGEAAGLDTQDTAERCNAMGWIFSTEGRYDDALLQYHQALAAADARGDLLRRAVTLHNIGDAHLACGRHRTAVDAFEQGLAVCRGIGDRDGERVLLGRLAAAYDAAGRHRRARRTRAAAAAALRDE